MCRFVVVSESEKQLIKYLIAQLLPSVSKYEFFIELRASDDSQASSRPAEKLSFADKVFKVLPAALN